MKSVDCADSQFQKGNASKGKSILLSRLHREFPENRFLIYGNYHPPDRFVGASNCFVWNRWSCLWYTVPPSKTWTGGYSTLYTQRDIRFLPRKFTGPWGYQVSRTPTISSVVVYSTIYLFFFSLFCLHPFTRGSIDRAPFRPRVSVSV